MTKEQNTNFFFIFVALINTILALCLAPSTSLGFVMGFIVSWFCLIIPTFVVAYLVFAVIQGTRYYSIKAKEVRERKKRRQSREEILRQAKEQHTTVRVKSVTSETAKSETEKEEEIDDSADNEFSELHGFESSAISDEEDEEE